ncbi:hypothetical protein B0T11DRAFT_291540 [Plectosphaerella cucumerina]|uniref:Uncharacterized protein n=1 Tax=Plectosphaerella cucumerina TaxID=40658 RepID=A0A8K0T8S5_9PEZI|nr:hypothetical protein B0T11DRAFT_291540 [Plectosphaerella cucumerina]
MEYHAKMAGQVRVQEASSRPYGWLASCLRWPSLFLFAVLDIILVVIVVALSVVSSRNTGFVTVPSGLNSTRSGRDADIFDVPWDLGVLWTALPSFVFALFGAYWAWIAHSLAERQPYVELRKDSGADAKRAVLLDYRVVGSVWRWWGALRMSHYTVGTTTLLSLALTYLIAPLAARLFAAQPVAAPHPIPIFYNETYNLQNINATSDWRPVLNVVSATLLYGGRNIPWTTNERAFRPFEADPAIVSTSKMEAKTTAYSAYLNCELIKDYTLTDGDKAGEVQISGTDRGCDFTQNFGVGGSQEIYLTSTVEFGCSAQAFFSRFIFTAAKQSETSSTNITDISVISCATGYRQVEGMVTVSPTPGSAAPSVDTFVETGDRDTARPTLWRVFESAILGLVTINPQAKWSTTDMANVILYSAQRAQPDNFLDPNLLLATIPRVFTAVYANTVAIHGFEPMSENETSTGKAFVPTTRLFVVPWVAYVILAFLATTLGTVAFVFFRLLKSPSILTEEPNGLLSMAAILDRSELLHIASHMRQDVGFDGGIWERGKKRSDVVDRKWRAEMSPDTGSWVIMAVRDGVAEVPLNRPPDDYWQAGA